MNPACGRAPSMRLGAFWLLYMCGLGIFFPWFSLYLSQTLGFEASRVGLIAATLPLVGLIAQPFWGWLADRTGSRKGILVLVTLGTAATTLALGSVRTFGVVWAVTAVVALFWTSVFPQGTAISLAFLSVERFPRVRVWGTIGFLFGVVSLPPLLSRLDAWTEVWEGLGWMFPLFALATVSAAGVAAFLPETEASTIRASRGEARRLLHHPPLRRLALVALVVHGLGHGPIVLLPLLVTSKGGGVGAVGDMWIAMLLVEIPLVAGAGRVLQRLGPRGLLRLGLWAEGARWVIAGLAPSLAWVQGAMLLHGFAVTGILVGIPLYAERSTRPGLRSSAQALVAMTGLGLGAVLSDVVAGAAVERWGPAPPFAVAGLGCLLLAATLPRILPEARMEEAARAT